MSAELMPPGVDVFAFDVCDTLFYSNTTFDYLHYVLAKQRAGSRQQWLRLLTQRWSPVYLALAAWQKLTGTDAIKGTALRLLAGMRREELYTLGRGFVQDFLGARRIAQTHALLAALAGSQTRIVLLSASLDPIVAAIAAELQVEFVSSQLDYDMQDRCTGRLARELSGQKPQALHELLGGVGPTSLAVATDNFSDHSLVAQAVRRYVVVHSVGAKKFWQDLNPQFIEAYV